jgi:hypothetical protein
MGAVNENDQTSYDLEPIVEAPELPGTVRMGEDHEEALDMLAADLFMQSSSCVSSFGHFHLALAHDGSTERVIMKLMTDPKYRSIPWDRTHVWSVRERMIEPGHPEHSMTHWRELAADPGEIPADQLHPMEGHLHDAHERYERRLVEHLEWRERGHDRLDYVILGADPGLLRGVDDPMDRLVGMSEDGSWIAMTRRLLNASRAIAVVGLGHDGRGLIDLVRENHDRIGLRPEFGALRWYLDAYACRCTDKEPL